MEQENSRPPLTPEQRRWIANLERDFQHLPMGYARAMVEMYIENPDFFTKENIDRLAELPPPDLPMGEAKLEILTGDDAEVFYKNLCEKNKYQQLEVEEQQQHVDAV